MNNPYPLEPPRRAEVAVGPRTDAVVEAIRRWHDDERHEGPFEFCTDRPCADVLEQL